MFVLLRRLCPRLLLLGVLAGLGYLARDFTSTAPASSGTTPADSTQAAPAQEAHKIGVGRFFEPRALTIAEKGILLALDHGRKPAIRRFTLDGNQRSSLRLPPSLTGNNTPDLLAAGPGDTVYLARARHVGIWKWDGSNARKINNDLVPAAIASRNGVLFILGHERQGITRVDGQKTSHIPLSTFPEQGYFTRLRLRSNGDFYVYADGERLVWRFDAAGKLLEKIGGDGEAPPKVKLTGDYISPYFDVDDNGHVYWALGDYGTLLKIDAVTGMATHFSERGDGRPAWLGNFAGLAGFVVHGGNAYILDRSLRHITGVPLTCVTPGAPDTKTSDTRSFSTEFVLESQAPYKVFTSPRIRLRAAFKSVNRKLRRVRLSLTVRDFNGKTVASPVITPEFQGNAPVTFDIPVFNLPRLGWYQVEAALYAADDKTPHRPLLTRVHYITRTVTDAAVPIPSTESTGWDDLATPRLVGSRLHRYALHRPNQIDEFEDDIRKARKIGMPYFILLINKKDCTPENARAIVEKLRSYGDDEPLIELMNEPNLSMSAREYVALLRSCRDAVKQANPRARIMGPVQCGTDLSWLESFFRAGGGELIDIVSLHTYERHNSMDASHWNWKFTKIRELLKKYHSDDKPLYQTEHGFLGDYIGHFMRPQWQANQILLEKLVLDRFGIDDTKYFYYYVNEGGYRDFSAYIVNAERELLPAAAMLRTRRHLLGDAQFVRPLNFTLSATKLLTAHLYRNAQHDVVILQNNGALEPIEVKADLPQSTRFFDCWGNPLSKTDSLKVGRTPLYLHLPRNAAFELHVPAAGHNIAPLATVTVSDAKGRQSAARLTNGLLEFDFLNQPERVGFLASDNALPLDLTLEWNAPRTISSAVVYGSLADNDKSTPLAYELWARRGDSWHKVATIDQTPKARSFSIGSTPYLTDYENPWIFQHHFTGTRPFVAQALRFRFKRTTYGHYPTKDMVEAIGSRYGQNFAPRVELREIEIYTP